jgi:hydrogenase maturation factor
MYTGPQLFLRYAFMPNQLGYCGGDDHRALLQYGLAGQTDQGLRELEQQFDGAYPYLQLIAHANDIADPLDRRVVEAYWLGNGLLDRVDASLLHDSTVERFKSRTSSREWPWLAAKPLAGTLPHHSFHVLEIYPRTGLLRSGARDHLVETMSQCCIRWGQVEAVVGPTLVVRAPAIVLADGKLRLTESRMETVNRWVDRQGFVDDVQAGEWVAIHWGWACDRLSDRQRASLARRTRQHLDICNQTW